MFVRFHESKSYGRKFVEPEPRVRLKTFETFVCPIITLIIIYIFCLLVKITLPLNEDIVLVES